MRARGGCGGGGTRRLPALAVPSERGSPSLGGALLGVGLQELFQGRILVGRRRERRRCGCHGARAAASAACGARCERHCCAAGPLAAGWPAEQPPHERAASAALHRRSVPAAERGGALHRQGAGASSTVHPCFPPGVRAGKALESAPKLDSRRSLTHGVLVERCRQGLH